MAYSENNKVAVIVKNPATGVYGTTGTHAKHTKRFSGMHPAFINKLLQIVNKCYPELSLDNGAPAPR